MKIKIEFDEENSKESKRMKKEDGRCEGAVDQTESGNEGKEGMDEKEGIIAMNNGMGEEEIGCRKFDEKNQMLNTGVINGNCEAEERVDCIEGVGGNVVDKTDENTKRGEENGHESKEEKEDKGGLGAVSRTDQVKEQEMIERKDKEDVVEKSDGKDEIVEESGRESKNESDRNCGTGSEKEQRFNGVYESSKKENEIKKGGRMVGMYEEQKTAHTANKVNDMDGDNDLQRLQRMQDQFLQKEEPVTANSVIIRNLDHTITKQMLIKHLHACGTIKSVEIPQMRKAGQSKQVAKNYAFVEFMTRSSVDIAVDLNKKLVINGKRVSIGRKKVFNK